MPEPILLNPSDNVQILTERAAAGLRPLGEGQPLEKPVASGHKIARRDIAKGEAILKFGQIIGYATTHIPSGSHVHSHNCEIGEHDQDYRIGVDLATATAAVPTVTPAMFRGYRRAGAQVGTRNFIAICATVNCSATVVRRAADEINSSGILREFPNVDGVVAFAHGTGCAMNTEGPGF